MSGFICFYNLLKRRSRYLQFRYNHRLSIHCSRSRCIFKLYRCIIYLPIAVAIFEISDETTRGSTACRFATLDRLIILFFGHRTDEKHKVRFHNHVPSIIDMVRIPKMKEDLWLHCFVHSI